MLAGLHQLPTGLMAKAVEPEQDLGAIGVKPAGGQAGDVFQQYSTRADLLGEPQSLREQVPLVAVAELLASDGERGTGQAPGKQVDVAEHAAIHLGQVTLDDRPPSCPVSPQRLAGIGVELD
jgi:hypothetical protein